MTDKPIVFIAYCHPGTITHDFHTSILRALLEGKDHGYYSLAVPSFSGVSIARNRNKLAAYFLQSNAEYMLMCDTDGAWPPEAVAQLLAHDVPIVSGLAMGIDMPSGTPFPAILEWGEDGLAVRRELTDEDSGLIKIGAVGMHFTLIEREVIEALGTGPGYPFAATRLVSEKDGQTRAGFIGEDVTFCLRAKRLGFDVYVDLDCPVGHYKARLIWPPGVDGNEVLGVKFFDDKELAV